MAAKERKPKVLRANGSLNAGTSTAVRSLLPHDLASDACDQRRLPAVPLLVARAKPIPAFRLVGSTGLLRILVSKF
jgi:hypothetical protein